MKPVATRYLVKGNSDYVFMSDNNLSLDDYDNIEDIIKYWSNEDMKKLIEQFDIDSDNVFPEHCIYSYVLTLKRKDIRCVLAYIDNVINPYVRIDYNAPTNRISAIVPNRYGNFSERMVRGVIDKENPQFPIIGYGFPAFLAVNAEISNGKIKNNPDDIFNSYYEERKQLFHSIHSAEYQLWEGKLNSYYQGEEARRNLAEFKKFFIEGLIRNEKNNVSLSKGLFSLYNGFLERYVNWFFDFLKRKLEPQQKSKGKKQVTNFKCFVQSTNGKSRDDILKRLHELIDGKSGADVGVVLYKAYKEKYLTKRPSQSIFETEFKLIGSWKAISAYMRDSNSNIASKAADIDIF